MSLKKLRLPALALLAIVFTWALMVAVLALPEMLDRTLRGYFRDLYWYPESIEAFMNYARPIGYACLAVVITLIVVGFLTEKKHLAPLGSFAFFLPTLGYFAGHMFFLAGIGILRVMWLPLLDLSPTLLKLGDIVYLPLRIATYPLILQDAQNIWQTCHLLANLIVDAGLLIFCIGTFTWLYGKLEKKRVFDFWIYKYSRHPQYLGFILWSYGMMLFIAFAPPSGRGGQPEPSFPWLISTLLIICIAIAEEIKMIKQSDEQYLKYRRNTPFMLPLPRFLSKMLTAPNRILLKKDFPESGREILYTFVIYCAILISLSILTHQLNLFEGML